MQPDPDHPILPDARRFRVVGAVFGTDPNPKDCWVDLQLRSDDESLTLRFWGARDVALSPTNSPGSLRISDISSRRFEDLAIEVDDPGAAPGRLHFFARSVERIVLGNNIAASYLKDLVFLLRETGGEAVHDAKHSGDAFDTGLALGYRFVLSLMQSQADAFQIPRDELRLDGFDAEVDDLD